MPPRMTATAWAQGAKNALICGVGLLIVWLPLAVVLWLISGQGILESFGLAWALLSGLIFLVFLGTWLYGRNTGGRVLLDCGPHPTKTLFLINASLFLIMGLTSGLATSFFGIAGPVFGVSFAAYWLIMATGRLQVRESGMWLYWSLLRWGKIGSYRWVTDSTLLVRANGTLSPLFQGALPVPPEHQQAVEEFLAEHCPAQAKA